MSVKSMLPKSITDYVPGQWFEARTIDEMQQFFLSRLPAIREAAHQHGYAIGLHGSTRRDLDIMAMQWRPAASNKDELARAIAKAACGIFRESYGYEWEDKKNHRFATAIPICMTDYTNEDFDDKPSIGHVDLSVLEIPLSTPPGGIFLDAQGVAHGYVSDEQIEVVLESALTDVRKRSGLAIPDARTPKVCVSPCDDVSLELVGRWKKRATEAEALLAQASEKPLLLPHGYTVEFNDGRETYFRDDPKGFREEKWVNLGVKVHTLLRINN